MYFVYSRYTTLIKVLNLVYIHHFSFLLFIFFFTLITYLLLLFLRNCDKIKYNQLSMLQTRQRDDFESISFLMGQAWVRGLRNSGSDEIHKSHIK